MVANHSVDVLFQITEVDSLVLKIEAEDGDTLPEYNTVEYSMVITLVFVQ